MLLVIAMVGNWVIRKIVKKIDPDQSSVTQDNIFLTQQTPEDILKSWGKRKEGFKIPPHYLPLHESFIQLLTTYQEVAFESTTPYYSRSFIASPFSENPDFLQIGIRGDGSEILIRLHSTDPQVYVADIEEGTPEYPTVFAKSIDEYWVLAKKEYEDASEILRKRGL